MKRDCLVCESEQVFDTSLDEDCERCTNCGSLPYSEVNAIVLGHRKDWKEMSDAETATPTGARSK